MSASPAWPALSRRAAMLVVGAWCAVMIAITLLFHPTPLYFVETDLVGEYLPSARELAKGIVSPGSYSYRGPGYPALIALTAPLFGGDLWTTARVVGVLAAGTFAALAFLLVLEIAGGAIATFTLAALLTLPMTIRYAIEAGTDLPTAALMMAATVLVLRPGTWRTAAVAGAITGWAVLMRGNAAFLIPCGAVALAFRARRLPSLLAWAACLLLPLAAWWLVARRAGLPPDRNHWTVAWELYGAGIPFDQYLVTQGQRFHSLLDVLAFDPARAATHVATNFAKHRLQDLQELVPPWIGALVPGLLLLPRTRATRLWFLHAALCAAVLALVFYNPRFGLCLAPLLVAAAGALLQGIATRWSASRAIVAVAVPLLLAANLFVAIRDTRTHLAAAPHETRVLGEWIEREARETAASADLGVMARKPHAAWFANRRWVPLPAGGALRDLRDEARRTGAAYLVYTPIEQEQRPQYALLADSGVVLPGFRQLHWIRLPRGGAAVYQLTDEAVDPAAFDLAQERALRDHVQHLPGDATSVHEVALQLAQLGRLQEALALIAKLRAQGTRDGRIEELRSTLFLEVGELDSAEAACREAMSLPRPGGWHWARLGAIRVRQERWGEARRNYQEALTFEPTNLEYLAGYSFSKASAGDTKGAATTLERALSLAPDDPSIRQLAIDMWLRSGEEARARALLDEGIRRGIPRERLLPPNR